MNHERTLADTLELRRRRECLICGTRATPIGTVNGHLGPPRTYRLARCPACGFGFIEDPRTDFEALYDEDYYRGKGADPRVAYDDDLLPDAIRQYEWEGITLTVDRLAPKPPRRWLDHGCGYGGLVRHVATTGAAAEAVGFDYGHPREHCAALGVDTLDEAQLIANQGQFDVITAIEVLEHSADPLLFLREVHDLLSDDGLFFATTGNAARHRRNLASWKYVIPEIHISFFEPRTLLRAYEKVGLTPVEVGAGPGMDQIIRYKVLKNLGRRSKSSWERAAPWRLVSRVADWKEGVSAQPVARRVDVAASVGDESGVRSA